LGLGPVSACRLHSDFRRLGPGRKAHVDGRLPYYLWQTNVLAALEAANFTSVLFHPPPRHRTLMSFGTIRGSPMLRLTRGCLPRSMMYLSCVT